MRKYYFFLSVLFALISCYKTKDTEYLGKTPEVIEYQIFETQYAVVIPVYKKSRALAQKMAMQRAAEITVEEGYRYFTVDEEALVDVAKSEDLGMDNFHENAYQEVIIDRNFTRKELLESQETINIYSGIRIVFTMYQDKPTTGTSVDACKLTKCKSE